MQERPHDRLDLRHDHRRRQRDRDVPGGKTVYGLARHNACVEPGDSGGANISADGYALGVTSGASTDSPTVAGAGPATANISWYQPIGEALSRNGLRLDLDPRAAAG